MAHALNELGIAATRGNDLTTKELTHLMDYIATHPDAQVLFRASDMILFTDSDAAYLVAQQARSHAAEFFYLGEKKWKSIKWPSPRPHKTNTDSHGICSGGRMWGTVYEFTGSSANETNLGRTRPQTAPNTITHRQQYGMRNNE